MRNKKLVIYLILGIILFLTVLVAKDIITTKKLPVTARYYGNFNDVKATYKLRDKMGNGSEYLLHSYNDMSGMSKKERIKYLLDTEVKGLNKY